MVKLPLIVNINQLSIVVEAIPRTTVDIRLFQMNVFCHNLAIWKVNEYYPVIYQKIIKYDVLRLLMKQNQADPFLYQLIKMSRKR